MTEWVKSVPDTQALLTRLSPATRGLRREILVLAGRARRLHAGNDAVADVLLRVLACDPRFRKDVRRRISELQVAGWIVLDGEWLTFPETPSEESVRLAEEATVQAKLSRRTSASKVQPALGGQSVGSRSALGGQSVGSRSALGGQSVGSQPETNPRNPCKSDSQNRTEQIRTDQTRRKGGSSSPPEPSPLPSSDRSGVIEKTPPTDLELEPTSPKLGAPDDPSPLDAPQPKCAPSLAEIRAEAAQLGERYSADAELLERAKVAGGLARNRRGELTDRQWLTFLRRLAGHDHADAVEALSRYVERHPDGEKPIEYALGIARGIALERKAGGRVPMPGLSRTGERVRRPPRRWHGVLDNPTVDDEPDDGSADRLAAEWDLDFSKCIDVKR